MSTGSFIRIDLKASIRPMAGGVYEASRAASSSGQASTMD
jgi:hypothetical protein